ncbi:ABC transporter permease, partial [Streptomyces resistomycificus]|uniref:ABC transporter permease n=1 Tax=Streptomyces resistomycificus TaxID=67356 RepID=UPI0004A9EC48
MSATTDLTEPAVITTEPTTADATRRRLVLGRFRDLSLVPAILVLGLIGFIVSPAFLTGDNLIGVAQQSTELSLLVLATALILICGRMDLSLESTIGVAPVIAVWLVLPTSGARFTGLGLLPEWTAVPLCLLVGVVIGAANGFLILKLRLNGFIVTLGMLTMLRGLQVALSEGQSIVELPSSFTYLGKSSWLGVPAAIWICVVLFALGAGALACLLYTSLSGLARQTA